MLDSSYNFTATNQENRLLARPDNATPEQPGHRRVMDRGKGREPSGLKP